MNMRKQKRQRSSHCLLLSNTLIIIPLRLRAPQPTPQPQPHKMRTDAWRKTQRWGRRAKAYALFSSPAEGRRTLC